MERIRKNAAFATWLRENSVLESRVPILEELGVHRVKAFLLSVGTAVLGFAAAMSAISPASEFPRAVVIIMVIIAVVAAALVVRFCALPRPGHLESILLVVMTDAVIAIGCLGHDNHLLGIAGVTLFGVASTFIMIYCSPRLHLAHAAAAAIVVLILMVWVPVDDGIQWLPVALAKGIGPLTVVCVILPVLHYFLWLLGINAMDAGIDPLTRIANRRGLERYLAAPECSKDRLAIIVLDIDQFKAINDTCGHHMGDLVLVRVARRLTEVSQGNKALHRVIVARVGGEEFAVLCENDLRTASAVAEDMRRVIAADASPSITVSAGVSLAKPTATINIDWLLTGADDAMYASKRRGGNQVSVAGARFSAPSGVSPTS